MATLQNIGALKYRGSDGQWHPLPVVVQDTTGGGDGGVSTISGNGAPTSATEGKVNQLYRDEETDKLYVCTSAEGGVYTWAVVTADADDVVKYTAQNLTNTQKQQARVNIGAGTSNFSGSYNDLSNKPNIPAATPIDTTLTQSGQAADAKSVGDALASKANASAIPNVPGWAMQSSKPTYTAAEVGALPDTTVIPDVSGKVDKQQGAEHAGQVLAVGEDGDVVPIPAEFGARDAVTYTEQSLTDAQKQQARANIGVDLFLADAVAVLAETGVLTPAYYDGSFYTSPQGEIYTI